VSELRREVSGFEDLEVFQRAYKVALEVHRASLELPAIEQRVLADQLRRASKSICGNIAEGFGKQRRSTAEFSRFLGMAIGSADEIRVWLRFARDLGYIGEPQWRRWRDEYQAIARMLQGLDASWSRRRSSSSSSDVGRLTSAP
jgi:four helix bundle protein